MNEETKLILENQRMLLWENYRKWEGINLQHGGGGCIEMNEIIEQVEKINILIKPKDVEPTLQEKTHDALNVKEKIE